jgi:hypothetical protein
VRMMMIPPFSILTFLVRMMMMPPFSSFTYLVRMMMVPPFYSFTYLVRMMVPPFSSGSSVGARGLMWCGSVGRLESFSLMGSVL